MTIVMAADVVWFWPEDGLKFDYGGARYVYISMGLGVVPGLALLQHPFGDHSGWGSWQQCPLIKARFLQKENWKLDLSLEIMEAHSFFTNTNNAGRCSAPACWLNAIWSSLLVTRAEAQQPVGLRKPCGCMTQMCPSPSNFHPHPLLGTLAPDWCSLIYTLFAAQIMTLTVTHWKWHWKWRTENNSS